MLLSPYLIAIASVEANSDFSQYLLTYTKYMSIKVQ